MIRHEDDLFSDAAATALEKLKAGEIDEEFLEIVQGLTVTTEQPAVTEGTLLMVGGELHQASETLKKIEAGDTIKPPSYRNALIYLAFAQGEIMRNGLRNVGKEILRHCVELSNGVDEEVTTMLVELQGFDHNAPSIN